MPDQRVLVTESYLEDIADSIRAKLGTAREFTPGQMSDAIDQISGGGGITVEPLSVNTNGTYTAPAGKAYSPVNVSVPGSATLIAKNITQNGTYNASSDNADGYSSVTVDVPDGGIIKVDRRNWGSYTDHGVDFNSGQMEFNLRTDYVRISPVKPVGITVEVDIASMTMTLGNYHKRFVMASETRGLVYRKDTSKWGFYVTAWEDSDISDINYFDDSTIKIEIDSNGYWHIYKDNTLIFEPAASLNLTDFQIGSSGGQSIDAAIITGIRIY